MTVEDQAIKVAEVEHRAKSNTRRIEKLELQTESIHSIATSVEVMVSELGHQTEAIERIEGNVGKLNSKVEALEKKPGKRWDSIVDKVLLAIVGGIVCYLLARLGIA